VHNFEAGRKSHESKERGRILRRGKGFNEERASIDQMRKGKYSEKRGWTKASRSGKMLKGGKRRGWKRCKEKRKIILIKGKRSSDKRKIFWEERMRKKGIIQGKEKDFLKLEQSISKEGKATVIREMRKEDTVFRMTFPFSLVIIFPGPRLLYPPPLLSLTL
jgi:hypothetical protein